MVCSSQLEANLADCCRKQLDAVLRKTRSGGAQSVALSWAIKPKDDGRVGL